VERRAALLLFVGLSAAGIGPAFAYDDGDWRVWQNNTLEARIADGWKVKIAEEFRIGDDASELYEQFTEIGVTHALTPCLRLGIDYRHDYRLSENIWGLEKRPQLNATLVHTWCGFGVSDRSRLERRMFATKDDEWRYRNKLTVTLPGALTGSRVQVYVAGEAFVDFDPNDLSRYRLYLGVKGRVFGPFSLDLKYFRQSTEKGDDWLGTNVMYVGVKGGF